jgi:hypothetical protein
VTGDVEAIPLNMEVPEAGDPDKIIEEIAAVARVPLYKLRGNDPIKANSETADYAWLRDTILPYCRLDEEQLNARYLPLFHILGHACLRTLQFVRAPTLLQDYRTLENAIGATLPQTGAPHALGVIPAGDVVRVPLDNPVDETLSNISTLAVSLEPPGGSPTGKPTGPVLYSGRIERMYSPFSHWSLLRSKRALARRICGRSNNSITSSMGSFSRLCLGDQPRRQR